MHLPGTDNSSSVGSQQLTYCTNIHPANGWAEVRSNLETYAPRLKARFSPHAPFGIGLRLSAAEAVELLEGSTLEDFRSYLDAQGLYVALINGYPFGHFSGQAVKDEVFAPDWSSDARVRYTLDLLEILAALLPDGADGGISTVPLSYKRWNGADPFAFQPQITNNLARVCTQLARIHRSTGRLIHLDIEPEPDGLIENTAETIFFFSGTLSAAAVPVLTHSLGVVPSEAEDLLRRHIRLCYDTCHFAVEYEEPAATLAAFKAAGIEIGRVQISSALAIPLDQGRPSPEALARLQEIADPIYLHQVIERRRDNTVRRYRDLPDAFKRIPDLEAEEWRIHFHVPLFAPDFGGLASTRESIRATLRANPATTHYEIETYTWNILPENLRLNLGESIAREYAWVLDELCTKPLS
jgi:hypothetical protein